MSADGKDTAARLVAAMWSWRAAAKNFDRPRPIVLPTPKEIQLRDGDAAPRRVLRSGGAGAR